ncbi:MAG: CehA/McbA family metallohydrolase [Armatimonadetes bacterium]|nr:CehA/McbA family metallohydrolase [Armatimonadota bacterium]
MSKPTGIMVVAPSTVTAGEEFTLGVKVLREPYFVGTTCSWRYPNLAGPFNLSPRGISYMDNAAERWEGQLVVEGPACLQGPEKVSVERLVGAFPGDSRALGRVGPFSLTEPGTYTIVVRDPLSGAEGTSNLVEVHASAPPLRLYWGDLHSQTIFSDGLRCPDELYCFARDEAFLDISALADHSSALMGAVWDYMVAATNLYNDPGRFVTLVGFEWTSGKFGHRNLYYQGDEGPVLSHTTPDGDTLDKLYALARREGALLVPHHSANAQMGVNWDLGHEPEHERLVEIHSIWGNSERPASAGNPFPILNHGGEQPGQHVIDALARGYRFGFVGGGDIHDGRPGDELHNLQQQPPQYRNLRRQGIMGVWMPDLTREALWQALWARCCYATTNVRVILRFWVCGAFMGQTVSCAGERPIRVEAASEVPISHIEIVKNGEDWQKCSPGEGEVAWEVQDEASPGADYYYARVTREDGHIAWSSPVWVNS